MKHFSYLLCVKFGAQASRKCSCCYLTGNLQTTLVEVYSGEGRRPVVSDLKPITYALQVNCIVLSKVRYVVHEIFSTYIFKITKRSWREILRLCSTYVT
jgi:hypothetical protein